MTDIESGTTEIQRRIVGISRKDLSPICVAHRASPRVITLQGIPLADPRIHVRDELILAKATVGFVCVDISAGKRSHSAGRDGGIICSRKKSVDILRSQAVDAQ